MRSAFMVTGPIEKFVAEEKGLPTRDELIELLHNEVVEVTFTKLDGDERVMPCTLQAKYFPDPKKESTQKHDNVVAVWAIESKGFRSFRYDRLKAIKILKEE
tara:strand:+ start:11139 stop:11444 length:306 start_codon:yes stop_codon:yes gene_type:complete